VFGVPRGHPGGRVVTERRPARMRGDVEAAALGRLRLGQEGVRILLGAEYLGALRAGRIGQNAFLPGSGGQGGVSPTTARPRAARPTARPQAPPPCPADCPRGTGRLPAHDRPGRTEPARPRERPRRRTVAVWRRACPCSRPAPKVGRTTIGTLRRRPSWTTPARPNGC
jgi:hypothetical protein